MTTSVEGGCLCGAVRYQASGEALVRTLCHCRSCRLASGAPSLAWVVFPAGGFRYTAGAPTGYASSPGVTRTFCGACGTSLTWQQASRTESIDVATATLDNANDFAPTKEIWVEHKLEWEALSPDTEHYARSSVGAMPNGD
jgi:hypothetical protein